MGDEKRHHYSQHDTLPIPTYEQSQEASRPSSSQSFLGSSEISQDAERQGLLSRSQDGYNPPTVQSERSSLDTSATDPLPRHVQQMDILEPEGGRISLRDNTFSKRITNLSHTLSSIHIPFRQWLPSRDYILAKIPSLIRDFRPNWILVGRLFALVLVILLAYLLFLSDIFTTSRRTPASATYYPDSIRTYLRQGINKTMIHEHARYLTLFPHVAGTEGSFVLAEYIQSLFLENQLEDVRLEQYDVYLNYPKEGGRRVAIIEPQDMVWEAKIEESGEQFPVFHGLSFSGTARGHLIYANYGSREDFQTLQSQGIDLKGSIALIRYHGDQEDQAAIKVKAAELAGAVGCIIYSDPAEDGFLKGQTFPDGRFLPSDGVHRGTVSLTSWVAGDVLTPGFASIPGEERRESKEESKALNKIPSIPLAWRDAQKLLQALQGHGVELNAEWRGGVGDVEWWSGDQGSPLVEIANEQDEVDRRPIYNVLGKIVGIEQPEKKIVIGSHRDAWCLGASNSASGTATMLEVVRVFGELLATGWRPLRSIEFASWDGEEYNLIGSTEHVENRIDELRRNGIAYLNVDSVAGSDFEARASPVLRTALLRVLEEVADPRNNQTLRSIWSEKDSIVKGLGPNSVVAFQYVAGTSSLDMAFSGSSPYHSCYDTLEWMDRFGDPDFLYHGTIATIWALLILEIADRELLPFDFVVYASAIKGYVEDLEGYAKSKSAENLDLTILHTAVDEFTKNAEEFHEWDKAWEEAIGQGGFESNVMAIKRLSHNARMSNFETNLLDVQGGLPGREQFVHVINAPQTWSGHEEAHFPGIRDAIDELNWPEAQMQVEKAASILSYACQKLNH